METVETALKVPKVLDDNLEVVDDIESNNNEGVEVQDSVEEMVKIDQASAAPDNPLHSSYPLGPPFLCHSLVLIHSPNPLFGKLPITRSHLV